MKRFLQMFIGSTEPVKSPDVAAMSSDELVSLNQDLGRQQDEIRERRKLIADELRRRKGAVVAGQVLDVKAGV